ncbi:unnamed protein product [Brassica rapa subsp. narinosa]
MDGFRFQGSAGHLGPLFFYHHDHKHSVFQTNNLRNKLSPAVAATNSGFLSKEPSSPPVSATKSGFLCKEPSIPFLGSAMEAATKWDPIRLDARGNFPQMYSNVRLIDQQVNAASLASSIELKLEEARARIEVSRVRSDLTKRSLSSS